MRNICEKEGIFDHVPNYYFGSKFRNWYCYDYYFCFYGYWQMNHMKYRIEYSLACIVVLETMLWK